MGCKNIKSEFNDQLVSFFFWQLNADKASSCRWLVKIDDDKWLLWYAFSLFTMIAHCAA